MLLTFFISHLDYFVFVLPACAALLDSLVICLLVDMSMSLHLGAQPHTLWQHEEVFSCHEAANTTKQKVRLQPVTHLVPFWRTCKTRPPRKQSFRLRLEPQSARLQFKPREVSAVLLFGVCAETEDPVITARSLCFDSHLASY